MDIDDSTLRPGGALDPFFVGQQKEAVAHLGDPKKSDGTTPDWDERFLQDIHGVIIITGDSPETVEAKKEAVYGIFHSNSVNEIIPVFGEGREDPFSAHEQSVFICCLRCKIIELNLDISFGFLDGVSEPAVKGFDDPPKPGEPIAVNPGVIVTGYDGDLNQREPWARDGSFLVFRWLFQLVPNFNNFLRDNALKKDGEGRDLPPGLGADLLGARMVGRWKSGAPIVQAPWKDNKDLAR